jgi:transglutaminase-like putative cysteine protease
MTRFDLAIALDYEIVTPSDFVLVIQPTRTSYQRVTWERLDVHPAIETREEACGEPASRHLRLHAEPGPLRIHYEAIVDLVHHFALPADVEEVPAGSLPASVLPYVYPSRYCPSDRMLDLARREFGSMAPGYARVEAVRAWVQSHVRFQPGSSDTATTAIETYDCRAGVCRDYSHLMITMLRALNIPARLATGIDYGADPALGPTDFHCYVEVYLSGRWFLFDPSGISPRMGLIRIGTGRDAADVAFATIFGTVRWTMPRIRIRAEDDALEGLVEPFRHDYAISTDASQAGADDGLEASMPPPAATSASGAPRWQ